jgi:hypothetical protein
MIQRLLSSLFFLTLASSAQAAIFTLPQLDPSQIDPLDKELAADLAFRPVEGAAPLTGLGPFGFSVGVSGVATKTSSIQSIIGSSPEYIPGAFVNLAVGLPFGLGVEFGFVPNVSIRGTSFSNYGGDIRWNFSQLLSSSFPFDMALRGMVTSASLTSDQEIDGASVNAAYKSTITGMNLTLAKTILFFEPYVAAGFANSSSKLSYSGDVSLFNSNFSSGTTSVSSSNLGFWGTAGLQVRLLFLQVGAEYATMWGNSTYAGKVAFRF